MKKYLAAAVLAVAVAGLASAAFGSTKSPARTSSAASPSSAAAATVTCRKAGRVGSAAAFPGPGGGNGKQEGRWAELLVKPLNRAKANRNKQIKVVPGDTQLGNDTAF